MKTVVLDPVSEKHADEIILKVEERLGMDVKMKDLIKYIFSDPNEITEFVIEKLKKRIVLVDKKEMRI